MGSVSAGPLICTCSRRKNRVGNSPNKHVLVLACAWSVPLAVVQIIISWVSLGFEDDVDLQHEHTVLHHFFAPYSEGTPSQCSPAGRCQFFTDLSSSLYCQMTNLAGLLVVHAFPAGVYARLRICFAPYLEGMSFVSNAFHAEAARADAHAQKVDLLICC